MNGKILKNVGSCASFYNNCYRTNEIEYNDLVENGDTVYFMENHDGKDEIFSMNVSDYPSINMFNDYINIDVQEIFNSAQNSSFSQKEDKSYDVSITCDTSKDLGFIENIDFDFSLGDMGMVAFNTTECKINMNISEDFFVTKINIEFSQTAETIEMTYTCKYEISFISSDNTVAPPAGMDIEKAETREKLCICFMYTRGCKKTGPSFFVARETLTTNLLQD